MYLYVAYQGQAFFDLPRTADGDGLTTVANVLPGVLRTLKAQGFRVVLVLSSALLDRSTATAAGLAALQPGSNVIDPVTAIPLVSALVRRLAAFHPAGIYVGEPFDWAGYVAPAGAWTDFYAAVRRAAHGVPLDMLLATSRDEYAPLSRVYGSPLFTALARSGDFAALGIDGEGMVPPLTDVRASVAAHWAETAPSGFAQASHALGGRTALDEIPIIDSNDMRDPSAAPIDLVQRAIEAAARDRIQGIVIFADEYLGRDSAAYQRQLGTALTRFLAGSGARAAAR